MHGIGWVVADEVAELPGATIHALRRREVEFDLAGDPVAALGLRTADDVLATVGELDSPRGKAEVANCATTAADLDWGELPRKPVIDVVAAVETRRPFNRFAVEAALGSALAHRLGGSYLARTSAGREPGEPTLVCRVFVREDSLLVCRTLATTPLHRRPYKLDVGPGSLHPPLATALARLALPASSHARLVLDPFCGDGTLLIEAALLRPELRYLGRDIDPSRLRNAGANAARAGVTVELAAADAAAGTVQRVDVALSNPPWQNLVGLGGAARNDQLWSLLSRPLRRGGVLCALIDDDVAPPAALTGLGWLSEVSQQVRVGGRLARLTLARPSDTEEPVLTAALAHWRAAAIDAGVLTDDGF